MFFMATVLQRCLFVMTAMPVCYTTIMTPMSGCYISVMTVVYGCYIFVMTKACTSYCSCTDYIRHSSELSTLQTRAVVRLYMCTEVKCTPEISTGVHENILLKTVRQK
jgi:hypothetical protein